MLLRRSALLLPFAALAGCAADVTRGVDGGAPRVTLRNPALNPRNGGLAIDADALLPGDIVLSSANGINSIGVRLVTLSPVSHACLYVGEEQVAEAVGRGVRQRSVDQLLQEEATVVAFRHTGVRPEHVRRMRAFVDETVGRRYNFVGAMLYAPFSVERRLCELPVVPSLVRDFCVRGVGAIQLGIGRNDLFFCSQFVLEAYKRAGLPLTDADPVLISPADLMHMREGDVPSVRIHQPLLYVGHLKFQPAAVPALLAVP